jgi:hypothetical protein
MAKPLVLFPYLSVLDDSRTVRCYKETYCRSDSIFTFTLAYIRSGHRSEKTFLPFLQIRIQYQRTSPSGETSSSEPLEHSISLEEYEKAFSWSDIKITCQYQQCALALISPTLTISPFAKEGIQQITWRTVLFREELEP